jgi:hypothetical protein
VSDELRDQVREYLEELRENWDDPYWRADHPEVVAAMIAIVTGAISLIFTTIDLLIRRSLSHA